MATIKETDLEDNQYNGLCGTCDENEGAIWLCGEGYLCTECFAKMSDIEEAEAFEEENINKENKDKIRGVLAKERMDATS